MSDSHLPPNVLNVAIYWLEATLVGTVATTLAVVCVAWIGVMMLGGRLNVRHGLTTIFGCFLIFGATSISAGIRCAAQGECAPQIAIPSEVTADFNPPPMALPPPIPVKTPEPDPYAGAAIRRR